MSVVVFGPNEHTRLLGTEKGDRFLCSKCVGKYKQLGVPASAAGIMFGFTPFPTGQELCEDCERK